MKNRTLFPSSSPFARRMKFRNILPLLALIFALSGTACGDEPVVGPHVSAPSFSVQNGPVAQSFTGNGLSTEMKRLENKMEELRNKKQKTINESQDLRAVL